MNAAHGQRPCVVLISPGIIKWTDLDFGLPHLVSLGGYLLEHIGAHRVRVEILDLGYEGGDHQHLARQLDAMGPILCIGLSCYSSYDYLRVMAVARFLKRLYPDTPLVTGGYHASALPTDVIFDGSPFDAVLQGEGERSLASVVETLLGGGRIEEPIIARDVIEDLDSLPPYRWDLLDRYWPRAQDLGRKFQIYLSRGCVYHCTFCMERAKSGYQWRAYSPERAIEELQRLSRRTDLGHWVVNLADPLFGFHRRWRKQVLEGIVRHKLLPRQYWTLTRADDLDEEDVQLLARARFSIGIGLESGSPEMLRIMQKGNTPERYLGALQRLARLSRQHGLNWAANIIIGHPGETPATMEETHRFLTGIFTEAKETCGWLSIDPFRLYPGAHVHETLADYERRFGARFYHPRWWTRWYDGPFRAEHIDPSSSVSFEQRVAFMYDRYAPLVREILSRFRGQGRSIDRVFRRSLDEQARQMSPQARDQLIAGARRARAHLAQEAAAGPTGPAATAGAFSTPIGLQVRDPQVRRREAAVRRLLERGVLRTEALVEALLVTPLEDHLPEAQITGLLDERPPAPEREGDPPGGLGLTALAFGLEAVNPGAGDTVADLLAVHSYLSALMAHLVGPDGHVLALHPGDPRSAITLRARLATHSQVEVRTGHILRDPDALNDTAPQGFDGLWLGACLPWAPKALADHLVVDGRALTILGPRFRPQDLVCLTRRTEGLDERSLLRIRAPILAGPGGWIRTPR